MSFSIPPSPEPDRDWALVPGNHTDFTTLPLLNLLPNECKRIPQIKLVVNDMAAFRGFCSLGGDAGYSEAPPPFG
jgi:hypothetical protein